MLALRDLVGVSEALATSHRQQEWPSEAPVDTCISQGFRENLADMWGCPVHESRIRERRLDSSLTDDILHFRKFTQTHSGTTLSGLLPKSRSEFPFSSNEDASGS